MKNKRISWSIKLLFFLVLIGLALFFMVWPMIQSNQIQHLATQQKDTYQKAIDQLKPKRQQELEKYEKNYNHQLFTQKGQDSQKSMIPAKQFYNKTQGYMGFLSVPIVGLKEVTIGYRSLNQANNVPFVHRESSSLPGNGKENSCMVVELQKEWRFQEIVSKLQHVKVKDSLYLGTHYGKDWYEVLSVHSYHPHQEEDELRRSLQEGNHIVIRYQSPLSGGTEIMAKRISSETGKKFVAQRHYFSYSINVVIFLGLLIGFFFLLVAQYRKYIQTFYVEEIRFRTTTRKQLYTLLQGTKAYLLIVGLMATIFLVFIGYVYGSF
ncbi:MAG: hypothetical protein ACLTXM_15955 [Enterococcus sp.]